MKWKYTDENNNYDTSFRFIFYDETLKEFEKSSQDSKKGLKDYIPGYIQIYPEGAAQRKMGNIEDSLRTLDDVLSLDPKHPYALEFQNSVRAVFVE